MSTIIYDPPSGVSHLYVQKNPCIVHVRIILRRTRNTVDCDDQSNVYFSVLARNFLTYFFKSAVSFFLFITQVEYYLPLLNKWPVSVSYASSLYSVRWLRQSAKVGLYMHGWSVCTAYMYRPNVLQKYGHFSGVTTGPADPAMRGGLWGHKIVALFFSL